MSLRDENRMARHQIVWDTAKHLGTFTYDQLAKASGVSRSNAQDRVRGWMRAGLIAQERKGSSKLLHFRVLDDDEVGVAPVPAPRAEGVEPNCWTVMRRLPNFTPTDVASHATTETCPVSVDAARAYCQVLLQAGYLRVVRRAMPGKREAVYRLILNTGPVAPRLRRVRAIEDTNLGTVSPLGGRA